MEEKEVKDPYGFIYITTNLINGKRYIGQKKFDGGSRWKSYLGSGNHLREAIKKYGKENFIRNIVYIAHSPEELNDKEYDWIKNYNAVESDDYYNRIEGGDPYCQLVKRNSVPIICLNNRMMFNSIADAIGWSGHTESTIKNTYNLNYKKNRGKKLIFRPLTKKCSECNELFYSSDTRKRKCEKCGGYTHCVDCGDEYKKKSNRQVRCEKCAEERTKVVDKLHKRKSRKKLELSKEEFNMLIETEWEKKNKIWLKLAKKRPRHKSKNNVNVQLNYLKIKSEPIHFLSKSNYLKLTRTNIPLTLKEFNKEIKTTTIHHVHSIEELDNIIGEKEKYICIKENIFENDHVLFEVI